MVNNYTDEHFSGEVNKNDKDAEKHPKYNFCAYSLTPLGTVANQKTYEN